jgi:hypothetical protein
MSELFITKLRADQILVARFSQGGVDGDIGSNAV